jgi:hypothetical protein
MSDFTRYRERSGDVQDGTERHVWGEQEYISGAGSIIKVRGTDSKDEEAEVVNLGQGFNVKKDFNTEVFLLSSSSDTTLKQALLSIPKDKQRKWSEGHGGIQHPTENTFALDFSDDMAHLTKNKFAVGEKGEFEVKGDTVYVRAKKMIIDGELIVNKEVKSPAYNSGTENPPGFTPSKEASAKGGSSGGGGAADFQNSRSQAEFNFGPQLELPL